MIELKFIGDAADVRTEMMALLDLDAARVAIHQPQTRAQPQPGTPPENAATLQSLAGEPAVETVATGKPARRSRQPKPQTIEGEVTSKTETPAAHLGDPETAAQDKADEKASEEQSGAKVYTLEDVRLAAKGYIDKWDLEAASIDLVPCMLKAVGVGKMSELAALNDAAKFEAAAKAIDAAVAAGVRYAQEGA